MHGKKVFVLTFVPYGTSYVCGFKKDDAAITLSLLLYSLDIIGKTNDYTLNETEQKWQRRAKKCCSTPFVN